MDISLALKAILLGIIEGLTEFIPVSSTGHLLLASQFMDFSQQFRNNVFEIVIQLGAILAVCFYYRRKIFSVLISLFSKKEAQNFSINLFLAFFPSVIFGVLFYDLIKNWFFNPVSIALALIIGGLVIILIEKMQIKAKCNHIDDLSKSQALMIGLFQIVSMIPGVSRSGATIMGGLLVKMSRVAATEFSFFLAIPTIFAASVYDLYKNYQQLDLSNYQVILIGFITAFLSSLIVIKWFINFVSRHNFIGFAYYRIIIGILILLIVY